jgi:hypothetical protein
MRLGYVKRKAVVHLVNRATYTTRQSQVRGGKWTGYGRASKLLDWPAMRYTKCTCFFCMIDHKRKTCKSITSRCASGVHTMKPEKQPGEHELTTVAKPWLVS